MTGRVGRWTGVKKEVVIMLYVLSQTVGCYAANQLPSSDVQQNGMSDNMLNNQRVVVHKDDISEHAEKSQSMVYVKRFQLDVSGIEECLPPPKALLGKYSGRNLAVNDLQQLTKALSVYYRKQGYPVATAFLPRQDIVAGIVTIKVFPGVLDKLRVKNSTSLEDRFVEGFLKTLYAGMQLRSDILEMTLNNLNALPGVQAKGILEPGDKIGSSSLTIVLEASPIVEGAVYTDNYGGKYSGRYRYGMQVIVNEPLRSGDRLVIGGCLVMRR